MDARLAGLDGDLGALARFEGAAERDAIALAAFDGRAGRDTVALVRVEGATGALFDEVPSGLCLERVERLHGPAALGIRRRRCGGLLRASAAAMAAGAIMQVPLVAIGAALVFAFALVLAWRSIGVIVCGDGVFGPTDSAQLDEIVGCEVVARVQAEVRLVLRHDRERTVFVGSRAHARWIAQVIRRAIVAPDVAAPLVADAGAERMIPARLVARRGSPRRRRI